MGTSESGLADHQAELLQHLAAWVAANNVRPRWINGTLRMEDSDGTANVTVDFPIGFWQAFDRASGQAKQRAMHTISTYVYLGWPGTWRGRDAKRISVAMSWLEEL